MPKKSVAKPKEKPKKTEQDNFLKTIAVTLFGRLADRYSDRFKSLKASILTADLNMLFRTYISMMFFLTMFIFVLSFIATLTISLYMRIGILGTLAGAVILPVSFSSITFLLYYLYPVTLSQKRKGDIEANLPFAINHMSAIAGSGVPPRIMFKVISKFKEYGDISGEARKITRNVEVFGMDEMTSIKEVASKSPSAEFKDFLQGIISTIQTGGSLKSYLKEESTNALFEYRIKRDKYVQQLSIYADFYTALLIAAPLIFIVMLPILSMMQGDLFGMGITQLINLGMVLLVFMNIIFLAFLQATQEKM